MVEGGSSRRRRRDVSEVYVNDQIVWAEAAFCARQTEVQTVNK
jgi:hypothetical protein